MIFNRTKEDAENAIKIRNEKVKNFLPLSENEANILEKGMLTVSALNRIEDKQSELKDILNGIGYFNTEIKTKTWSHENIFNSDDIKRIFQNTEVLRKAFLEFSDTPIQPLPEYNFSNFNDLEKILYDLGLMVEEIGSMYRECGAFECGQEA